MDSLVANYTSSEEEDEVAAVETHKITLQQSRTLKPSSSLFSSLPRPQKQSQLQVQPQSQARSSSLFSSLPKPKQQEDVSIDEDDDYLKEKPTSSMLFSSLPQPQSQTSLQPVSNNPKKVILFNPPVPFKPTDDDDDEEEEEEQPNHVMVSESVPQSSSVKSFLSSIPAPKHSTMTLGSGSASSGSRKSILQTETTPSATSPDSGVFHAQSNDGLTIGNYHSSSYHPPPDSASFNDPTAGAYYAHCSVGDYPAESGSNHNDTTDGYSEFSYYSYQSSAGVFNYADYGNTFTDGSVPATVPETYTSATEDATPWRMPPEKRRRNGMMPPAEIVEVSQDDLTKNRPRGEQAKLTGIAFGPAYQPASSKGKPSKLHKRKHQIGSLYYDMKQKETELTERRAKGFLTKAQTQGKYGW